MKKYIGIALAVLMVLGLSGMVMAGNTTRFNFTAVVDPYIDVLVDVQNMATSPYHLRGPNFEGMVATYTGLSGGSWPGGIGDFAYANCPFQLTISGDNPAGDGKPIYAREEVDGTNTGLNRFDRLDTNWQIRIHTDYHSQLTIVFADANTVPWSYTANEAPHNGWVGIDFMCYGHQADGPDANIDCSQAYSLSPDAGNYKASLTIVLSVAPGYVPTP